MNEMDRRDFLKLAGMGGVVFFSGLGTLVDAIGKSAAADDFFFVQLSDTHWGFEGAQLNPDAKGTLQKAVAAVNSLTNQPDFIVFTGDLTHTTDDPQERRKRLREFKDIISQLKVKNIRLIPGEHDASLDNGAAYKEFFGETHYTFNHKGVHFITIDNVSDPRGSVGEAQLVWLGDTLKKIDKNAQIVVLTHRPLFDLYPQWDWATRDGDKVVTLLMPFKHVTVFYGHIHQEHNHFTGHIPHHAAKSSIYPLPAPGSVAKRAPIPWDPTAPYKGLGFREIDTRPKQNDCVLTEYPVTKV
jgi:3',5'-cyclic AMP phosphodiesterase CpdA